ncbi:hypothetical protein V8C37DRAFT_406660 [Trichoderma ceciliae]
MLLGAIRCQVVRLESTIHNNSRLNTEEKFLSLSGSLIVFDFKFYIALQYCLNNHGSYICLGARIHLSPQYVEEKRVKAAVNLGLLNKKPVFMITGLKIAWDFQLSRSVGSTTYANAKFEAPVTPDAGIGTDADYSLEKKAEEDSVDMGIVTESTSRDLDNSYK